jgi:carotenoid cleavage dioxygenase
MASPTDPPIPASRDVDLDVRGDVPAGLCGQIVGISRDGVVHSVQIRGGRLSYHGRRFRRAPTVHNVVGFGGSIFAFGDDLPAYELGPDLDRLTPVDLAGQGRTLAAYPKHDRATGALHLVASAADGIQAHVAVSAGALIRRSRPVLDNPSRIKDLALTSDHILFVADGFVGVASRDGEPRAKWIATGVTAPHAVHAHDAGDAVVLLALTPRLERWTVATGVGTVEREVLDPTPRHSAHVSGGLLDRDTCLLWTTGDETIGRHDPAEPRPVYRSLRPDVPVDFVVVDDADRPGDADSNWLVGFVDVAADRATDLRVIDANDIARRPLATVRIPERVPRGLRCTWIPFAQSPPNQSPRNEEN